MGKRIQKLNKEDGGRENRNLILKAFAQFNKWHEPESIAKLINLEGSLIAAELSGPFCRTCGVYDYFDDLKIELEEVLDKQLEVAQVDVGCGRYFVTYKITSAQTIQ
jgi:hypothetical protein